MEEKLCRDLDRNLQNFRRLFAKDAAYRNRVFQTGMGVRCAVLFFDGMTQSQILNEDVVRPLICHRTEMPGEDPADFAARQILYAAEVKKQTDTNAMIAGLLYGECLLLFDGCAEALTVDTKGWRTRGISEPENERVLQGPHEGFAEAAMPNLAQIRRKLQTPDLCAELLRVGRRSRTRVMICYLGSLAKPELVATLKKRIGEIDIDGILDVNYLNELIRDRKRSMFKTCGSTERPDVVAAKLLEGRVAIIADGTPVVLTVPYLFAENFQSDEDYYLNFWVSSVGRLLRYLCFFLAVSVPAIYLALITHHKRLLPTFLLLSAASSRAGVPFSSFLECLILIFVLEILKETGARMPQNVGHTLSIIGGLVVGQAAVEARLISASMLIVVALSGIAGLMIPRLRAAVFYLRLGLVVLSVLLGLPGVFLGITLLLIHLLQISSFGVPYLQPLQSPTLQGLKDTMVRLPWGVMLTRPAFGKDLIRQRRNKRTK